MKYLPALAAFLFSVTSLLAADWPQFRGPGAMGVAADRDLPGEWNADKNLRWKAPLPGKGLSNPVIAGGRIFVTAASGWQQKRLHVFCFDESTGKKLWERQFWATGSTVCNAKTNMAAPTPVTNGTHVFALFATQDLAALDRDGNLLWYRSLTGDYPTIGNNVGMASSPVLAKDVLIVDVVNIGESFVAGIDIHTGKNKWRMDRKQEINWTTPLVIDVNGKQQAILQTPAGLAAVDAASGKKVWSLSAELSPQASPIFVNGTIFAYGKKFLAIKPGDGTNDAQEKWQSTKLPGGYATPLFYAGKIYNLTSKGILRCADAGTGANEWELRLEGDFAASPVAANGKLYAVSEEGTTFVVDAAKPNVLHANPLSDKILATPVLANGAIYLRSDNWLYCIGNKKS